MRFLPFIIALIAFPAFAQTPVTKEMGQAYYNNCKAQPDPGRVISPQTKDMLCACTAAKMVDHMSVEDVQTMARQDALGRQAFNKMVVEVYAPCIQYPEQEYRYQECISNPQTKSLTSDVEGLCSCMAGEVASYLKVNAQSVFRDLLTRDPNMRDPLSALQSDEAFMQFAQSKLIACYQNYR